MTDLANAFPLAVDAMGGDLGPAEVVAAVALALREQKSLPGLWLVGDEATLKPLLKEKKLDRDSRLRIHHAPDTISMKDKPKEAFKKKSSSMLQALELVRSGQSQGVVSCGNTGALMFSGTLSMRKMNGVEKPALATVIPSHNHHFLLLDAGAQPETTAHQLVHNAILGHHYCRSILPYERPRVGLLTIGTEEGKGTDRILEAHDFLKQIDGDLIHYVGPIEGFDTFKNVADVVVCDGFTGNIVLKTLESCVSVLGKYAKSEITANPWRKLGAMLCMGAFKNLKQQLDPSHYAGAPLLGLKGLVLKTHGSSDRNFIKGAIRVGMDALQNHQGEHAQKDIEKANALMKARPLSSEPKTEQV